MGGGEAPCACVPQVSLQPTVTCRVSAVTPTTMKAHPAPRGSSTHSALRDVGNLQATWKGKTGVFVPRRALRLGDTARGDGGSLSEPTTPDRRAPIFL